MLQQPPGQGCTRSVLPPGMAGADTLLPVRVTAPTADYGFKKLGDGSYLNAISMSLSTFSNSASTNLAARRSLRLVLVTFCVKATGQIVVGAELSVCRMQELHP